MSKRLMNEWHKNTNMTHLTNDYLRVMCVVIGMFVCIMSKLNITKMIRLHKL